MTADTTTTTVYDVEGRLLEVCNCDVLCPCWVGEDPDGGTCDSIMAYAIDRGSVEGVDVSDRVIGFSVHIPGNVFAGNWRAVVYIDDRCTEAQQEQLLKVFTGQLGGPIADLAALITDVAAVERLPISCTVEEGRGVLKFGDIAEARMAPFTGATGLETTLNDTVFSTIPGAPAYPGKADYFRRQSGHGLVDVELSGKNSIQGLFHLSA